MQIMRGLRELSLLTSKMAKIPKRKNIGGKKQKSNLILFTQWNIWNFRLNEGCTPSVYS